MLTATGSLRGCLRMVEQMFANSKLWVFADKSIYDHGMDQKDFHVVLVGILIMRAVDMLQQKIKIRETLSQQPIVFRWVIYMGAVAVIFIYGMYGTDFDASSFVYGAF